MSDDIKTTPAALKALFVDNNLVNFFDAINPGGIEAQEARGQAKFVTDKTLPRICPRSELKFLGFNFGEDVDDVFVYVDFPDGWKKVPTDHSMWSDLIDDKGRKRGAIFYKAAFYDRNADLSLTTRYSYDYFRKEDEEYVENVIQYFVKDGNKVIFKSTPLNFEKKYDEKWYEVSDIGRNEAITWLNHNYPNWKNVMAYWEDE